MSFSVMQCCGDYGSSKTVLDPNYDGIIAF